MGNANVTILRPSDSVKSLADEVKDGSVQTAVERALEEFTTFDSDGQVPVETYDVDLAGAVSKAAAVAQDTDGDDLLVIVTDLVTDDRDAVENGLDELVEDGNGVVLVVVNNQPDPYLTAWGEKLDGDNQSDKLDRVDVLNVNEIPGTEVQGWFN